MNEFINFIKDILMLKKEDTSYIGLTRLNGRDENVVPVKIAETPKKIRGEIKISDLMRRAS